MADKNTIWSRLIDSLKRYRSSQLVEGVILTLEVGRQLMRDRSLSRTAASLAFTSILSLVPVLAVSFALFKVFVTDQAVADSLRSWMLTTFLADSVSGVVEYIEKFLSESTGGAVGGVGLTVLLVTSLSLLMSIENAVNQIWRVPTTRILYRRLMTFYAIITLAPAMIGVGSISANWLLKELDATSLGATLGGLVSWLLVLGALTLMYKLLPNTHVRMRAALAGGLGASLMLQLTRTGFNTYVSTIYSGSVSAKIYGAFALIPVFFLWIYIIWILILGGAMLAYFVQHRGVLMRRSSRSKGTSGALYIVMNGYLMCRVFYAVAHHFYLNGGGLGTTRLAHQLKIEEGDIKPCLHRLQERGYLLMVQENEDVEAVPGKPLDQITVAELYELAEEAHYCPGDLAKTEAGLLEDKVERVEADRLGQLSITFAQLLTDQEEQPA